MSLRNLLPLFAAVAVGIGTSYYTFNDILRENALQKLRDEDLKEAANLGGDVREIPLPQPPLNDASNSADGIVADDRTQR